MLIVAGPVGTVKKPQRFLRRLFQTACGNHKEKDAAGHRWEISTAVAVSTGLSFFFGSFFFLCEEAGFVEIGKSAERVG